MNSHCSFFFCVSFPHTIKDFVSTQGRLMIRSSMQYLCQLRFSNYCCLCVHFIISYLSLTLSSHHITHSITMTWRIEMIINLKIGAACHPQKLDWKSSQFELLAASIREHNKSCDLWPNSCSQMFLYWLQTWHCFEVSSLYNLTCNEVVSMLH